MKQVGTSSSFSLRALTRQSGVACASVKVGGPSLIYKYGSLIKDLILSVIKSGQQPEQERASVRFLRGAE